jgi:phosphatidylglycerophosphatase A
VGPTRRALFLLSTGFGSGYAPFAPGTFGTLAALPVWCLAAYVLSPALQIVFAVLFIPLAIVASEVGAGQLAAKDPGPVVVDEWAGTFVTAAGLPLDLTTIVATFFLFRLLDVVKPFPARRLEHLPGGFGIVLDDVMVGIYGNVLLRLVLPHL